MNVQKSHIGICSVDGIWDRDGDLGANLMFKYCVEAVNVAKVAVMYGKEVVGGDKWIVALYVQYYWCNQPYV